MNWTEPVLYGIHLKSKFKIWFTFTVHDLLSARDAIVYLEAESDISLGSWQRPKTINSYETN